ncbi:MAG: hypothetical protein ACI9VS_004182 [Candidatus Binatia bacterium]|jgi:hypothetical protein
MARRSVNEVVVKRVSTMAANQTSGADVKRLSGNCVKPGRMA